CPYTTLFRSHLGSGPGHHGRHPGPAARPQPRTRPDHPAGHPRDGRGQTGLRLRGDHGARLLRRSGADPGPAADSGVAAGAVPVRAPARPRARRRDPDLGGQGRGAAGVAAHPALRRGRRHGRGSPGGGRRASGGPALRADRRRAPRGGARPPGRQRRAGRGGPMTGWLDALVERWPDMGPVLWLGTLDTLYMVAWATLVTAALGLPLGVLLVCTDRGGLTPAPAVRALLGAVVNVGRSLPFIVLMV